MSRGIDLSSSVALLIRSQQIRIGLPLTADPNRPQVLAALRKECSGSTGIQSTIVIGLDLAATPRTRLFAGPGSTRSQKGALRWWCVTGRTICSIEFRHALFWEVKRS